MAFMTRSRQREEVFKLVFQVESIPEEDRDEHFRNYLYQLTMLEDEDKDLRKLAKISIEDKERIFTRAKTVLTHIEEIDALLNDKTVGWKTNRMNKVDLAILRLAVYEILYDEDIPESVAINEGVELAKKYSGDDGPAFVNSILGKFTKESQEKK